MDWAKVLEQIPAELETLDGVPDKLKRVYDRGDNPDGPFKFVGSENVFNAMKNAKKERGELSDKLASVTEQLAVFTAIGTPEDAKALFEKRAEIEKARTEKDAGIEVLRTEFQTKLQDAEKAAAGQITGWKDLANKLARDSVMSGILAGADLTDLGKEFMPMLLDKNIKIELDAGQTKVTVVNDKGEPRENDKIEPMTPGELMAEMKAKRPELFGSGSVTGGGSGGSNVDPSALPASGKKFDDWTPAEQRNYVTKHGIKAYAKLQADNQKAKAAAAA